MKDFIIEEFTCIEGRGVSYAAMTDSWSHETRRSWLRSCLGLGNRWVGRSYPWFEVHLGLGSTRFCMRFDTLIIVAWRLSLVGAAGGGPWLSSLGGCP